MEDVESVYLVCVQRLFQRRRRNDVESISRARVMCVMGMYAVLCFAVLGCVWAVVGFASESVCLYTQL